MSGSPLKTDERERKKRSRPARQNPHNHIDQLCQATTYYSAIQNSTTTARNDLGDTSADVVIAVRLAPLADILFYFKEKDSEYKALRIKW